MDCEIYCAEINLTALMALRLPEPTYTPLPKYPSVTRDLAVVCDEATTVAEVEEVIEKASGKLLRNIRLFDIYRGVGIPEGKKSMAFNLVFTPTDHEFTSDEIDKYVQKILKKLSFMYGIELR
jgi:phenylalanyl-tRNA synthetase beta chain